MPFESNKIKKVILIDDNPVDLQVCKMVLTRLITDVEFKTFDNGFTAMQWIVEYEHKFTKREKYILLLDLNMPELDGWGFLDYFERLKNDTKQKMSVYILTSSINTVDIERSKQFPSVRYFFSKPLTNKMIRGILAEVDTHELTK